MIWRMGLRENGFTALMGQLTFESQQRCRTISHRHFYDLESSFS